MCKALGSIFTEVFAATAGLLQIKVCCDFLSLHRSAEPYELVVQHMTLYRHCDSERPLRSIPIEPPMIV